jgi:hypothetical protein
MRILRDVLIEFVLASALTSLVLGHGLLGLVLLLVGIVLLSLVMRGHQVVSFGAGRKPSNTSSTGL